MNEVLLLLEAAPEILKLIQQIYQFAKSTHSPNEWINELTNVIGQINQSKTHEERQNAAKNLANLLNKSPS